MGMLQHLCWLIIIFGYALACPNLDTILPCQCANHGTEIQIWCSHSEVSRILSGLAAVSAEMKQPIDELILENNALPSLPGRAFSSLKVVRLMLRENGLQRVTANWLAGLEDTLVELFIVEPELRSLPDESLENLPRLEAVTLHAGAVARLPRMTNLTKLRYLHTRLPRLAELHYTRLAHLPALEQVHIVSSPLLSRLEQGMFENLPKLMLLNITRTGLTWLHPRALTRLPSLVDLSLVGNKITDAGMVGRSVRELQSLAVLRLDENFIDKIYETSFVDIPPLREIHLTKNYIGEIHRGAFHRLPSLRILNLSDNRIRKIHPEFFLQPFDSGLEELQIVRNELSDIMQLRVILEALPQLRFLDMSYNKLQDITYGSLRGHMFLERLHLDHNQLRRVVREAFFAMPALRELRLRNNSLSNYLEMPLWNLPALKGLDISYNEFHRLDRRMLANIPSLRRLDAGGNTLVTVDAAAFLGTPALEHVNLSHNALQEVYPATFSHLGKLFELDISYNRLRTMVPNLPPGLEYLHIAGNHLTAMPSSDVRLAALKYLDVSGNGIHRLSTDGFRSMPLLKVILAGDNALQSVEERTFEGLGRLEELDLHSNRLMTIHERAFRDLRRLNRLSLQGNRLDSLGEQLWRENTALVTLDLSRNQLTRIPDTALIENRALEELLVSHNALTSLPADLGLLRELRTLDASHNRLGSVPPLRDARHLLHLHLAHNRFEQLTEGAFADMPSLALLDLHSNRIQYMAPHSVRSLPNLTAVRLGRNQLTSLPSAAFSSLPSLLSAELQENQLTDVASDAFTAVPNLLMLNLSHNQLSGLERAGLAGLRSLEVLDLSHNRMKRFDSHSLPSLQALVHLKMDGNQLCNIRGAPFRKMSRLRVLSLRDNKMTSLPETTFTPLRQTMYSLDIEGNPLRCSCGLQWLHSWMHEAPYLAIEPRCHDGTLLRESRMTANDCDGVRYDDVPVAGCEPESGELLSGYSPVSGPGSSPGVGVGLSQISTHTDSRETTIRPLPNESEYFYEDFVEYEENSTLPFNTTNHSPIYSTSSTTESSLQTIPPGVLSHFIPGDTPTLYAGTKAQTSTPPSPSIFTRQPSSAFTFFGMPLPSLGSFWGSGRDADGRGRFTSSRGRGRVQQLPPSPSMEDGFQPLLPGVSGGFRPSFNPFNESSHSTEDYSSHSQGYSQETLGFYNHSQPHSHPPPDWDYPGNSLPHAHVSKVVSPYSKPKLSMELDVQTSSEESTYGSEQLLGYGGGRGESEEPTHRPHTSTSAEEMAFAISLPESSDPHHLPGSVVNKETKPAAEDKPEIGIKTTTSTSSFLSDLWGSINYGSGGIGTNAGGGGNKTDTGDTSSKGSTGRGPTSLSEFLAPGAPPSPKPQGRPTITKVTVSPPLGPGPIPMAEDLQGPIPRLAKSPPHHHYYHSHQASNDSMAWYYNNYNKSELEPYVGPGGRKTTPKSNASQISVASLLPLTTALTYCLAKFSAYFYIGI